MGKGSSKLKPKDLKSLCKETNFTESQVKEMYTEFRNEYPSGKVNYEQFKQLYSVNFPEGDSEARDEFVKHTFRTFDKNGDGVLVFREFLVAISLSTQNATMEAKLRWAFSMYDVDGNGQITKAEVQEIVKTIYKVLDEKKRAKFPEEYSTPEKFADAVFRVNDKNADGKITLDEFMEGAKSNGMMLEVLDI